MIDIPPEVKAYRDLHFPSRADTNAVIDSLLARLESEHDRAEDLLADKDEMLDALGHMIEDTPAEEIRRLKAILHDTQEAWLYERGKREKLERDLFAEASKKVTKVCGSCKWWIADSTDIGGVCKYRCLPRGFSEACVLWHRSDSDSLDVSCDRKDAGSGNMDDQHPEPGCSQPERSPLPEVERYWTCPRDVDLTAEDVWAVADVTVNALEDDSENWWLLYEQEKHGRDYWMSCAQKAEAEVSEMRERLAAGHKESDRRGERIEELEAALAHERDCRAAIVAEYGKRGPSAS